VVGEARPGAGVVVRVPAPVDVEVQADVAARVRITSATPAALDLRQRVNIYDAR